MQLVKTSTNFETMMQHFSTVFYSSVLADDNDSNSTFDSTDAESEELVFRGAFLAYAFLKKSMNNANRLIISKDCIL